LAFLLLQSRFWSLGVNADLCRELMANNTKKWVNNFSSFLIKISVAKLKHQNRENNSIQRLGLNKNNLD
jgi:hypothetical protein